MRRPGRRAKGPEFGGKIAEWPPNSTLNITTENPSACRGMITPKQARILSPS